MKRGKKGFTLVELLVVIAIIALLMSILMPALSRVKKQAKAAICTMNLRQWGMIYSMYTEDGDGYFSNWQMNFVGSGSESNGIWAEALYPYYKNAEIRTCPMVTRYWSDFVDGHLVGWGVFGEDSGFNWPGAIYMNGSYGSYGANSWQACPIDGGGHIKGWGKEILNLWKTINVKGGNNIPMLGGDWFLDGWPLDTDDPVDLPPMGGHTASGISGIQMSKFCQNRHDGYVGMLFFDLSVRMAGLKELWRFKWHRKYNVRNPFTTEGGMQASDWPDWMRKFKNYGGSDSGGGGPRGGGGSGR